jgi:hypothetical protein
MNKKPTSSEVDETVASSGSQEVSAVTVSAPQSLDRASLPQYRNIGPSLLTLDDGYPFPKGKTAGLTDAEVARLTRAGGAQKQRYIYPIAAPQSTEEGGSN